MAGLVTVFPPAIAPPGFPAGAGQLYLQGDGEGNEVDIRSTGVAGQYFIEGKEGTVLDVGPFPGSGLTMSSMTVNGVFGDIVSNLGAGSDVFTFEERAPGVKSTVPANLVLNNGIGVLDLSVIAGFMVPGGGDDTNNVNDVVINGGLWVTKAPGLPPTKSTLSMSNTMVTGPTIVTNTNDDTGAVGTTASFPVVLAGGGVGVADSSETTITNSQLFGVGVPAPVANLPLGSFGPGTGTPATPFPGIGYWVINGAGSDKLTVINDQAKIDAGQMNTEFGAGVFPIPLAGPDAVRVYNNAGGAIVKFGPATGVTTDANRIDVFSALTIANGANNALVMDMVDINQTDVWGQVWIYNDGGPGATRTDITNSNFGQGLVPIGIPLGYPFVLTSNAGADAFTMSGSTAQWGVFANHDDAGLGLTPWPSTTTITSSLIGTFGQPTAGAFATAFSADPVTGLIPVAIGGAIAPGDGFFVGGGAGADIVTVTGNAAAPTTIGGQANLVMGAGNNDVSFVSAPGVTNGVTMTALLATFGVGTDRMRLENTTVTAAVGILFAAGANKLELKGATALPNPLFGTIAIFGGIGVDTQEIDPTVTPGLGLLPGFEIIV